MKDSFVVWLKTMMSFMWLCQDKFGIIEAIGNE